MTRSCPLRGLAVSLAVLAILRLELALIAKVQKGVEAVSTSKIMLPPLPPSAPSDRLWIHISPCERDGSIAAIACFDCNLYDIYEHLLFDPFAILSVR
jgi:hypothetical protein